MRTDNRPWFSSGPALTAFSAMKAQRNTVDVKPLHRTAGGLSTRLMQWLKAPHSADAAEQDEDSARVHRTTSKPQLDFIKPSGIILDKHKQAGT